MEANVIHSIMNEKAFICLLEDCTIIFSVLSAAIENKLVNLGYYIIPIFLLTWNWLIMKKVKNSFNSKQLRHFLLIFLIPFTSLLSLSSGSNEILDVGKFSASSVRDKLPSNWKSFEFKRIKKHTRYTLVKDNGIVVVKASSDRSASGLIRKIKIDLKKYPRICWRWKISKVYS